jgi:hypothetical protein
MKKILFIVILTIISIFYATAQDCDAINSMRTFHGITLGEKFPESLRKHFLGGSKTAGNDGLILFGLWEPMVHPEDSAEMASWFNLGTDLSTININCLSDTTVSSISLYQLYRSDAPFIYRKGWSLDEYKSVIKELTYLFGEPIFKNNEYKSEGGYNNIMNVWNCNSAISITAYFYYTTKKASIEVLIDDDGLRTKEKMEKFKTIIK